jgi:hypothetical protein
MMTPDASPEKPMYTDRPRSELCGRVSTRVSATNPMVSPDVSPLRPVPRHTNARYTTAKPLLMSPLKDSAEFLCVD